MNTQQAYIEGFVKRAGEYGFSQEEAIELLKISSAADAPVAAIQTPSMFSGALSKIKDVFKGNSPTVPSVSVRQFGMTNKGLESAQNQLENAGQLNLAGG